MSGTLRAVSCCPRTLMAGLFRRRRAATGGICHDGRNVRHIVCLRHSCEGGFEAENGISGEEIEAIKVLKFSGEGVASMYKTEQ